MSKYTPTTYEVMRRYVTDAIFDYQWDDEAEEEFHRWLARHDAEVARAAAERAWDECTTDASDNWSDCAPGVGMFLDERNPYQREGMADA